ncbi:MAG: N-6 DNA methylase [Candidatus Nanoarchaeia archaeon]|nr:N-6 DNA methylase [Candidatus Nanoarchaeia archaeon]
MGALGFKLLEGEKSIWIKEYLIHDRYIIKIDLSNKSLSECKIFYGDLIKVWRNTTTNFSQRENLVVLECVNRLLEKGYKPQRIELEKSWKVGGFLDILVKGDDEKSYLMIECKQWGNEYNRAIKIILQNEFKKEQLFNYYLQEKSTKYVALYCSTLSESLEIIYRNDIIQADKFRDCDNQNEIYQTWDKVFQSKGIFEKNISPYNIQFLGVIRSELKTLDQSYVQGEEDTEGTIYNRFAEILRRHTVSDKTNAYNKIFNLFLCKIVDEDGSINDEDEMLFQWKEAETAETVLGRLNDLYKKGMKDYLKLDVADVTENELDAELKKIINGSNGKTIKIKQMFKQLRLYKNNEFAFKEVIDERTFLENSEVVKEVVKLLEPYQIKYSHKQQFLGEFFERLLNIGVKQEAGQYFTPLPITTFICKSIPFEAIIKTKIEKKDPYFLPYAIDYACGSGHFLTEAMDRIDKILQSIQESDLKSNPQKDNFVGWKRSFKWANEFIYGIEKDYRLAKTTKVACFLNGDGEANIFYADGLDSFTSEQYKGKLKLTEEKMDNPVFDVVIANPPYSVENFKFVLKNGKKSFELFDSITDKSDDIECLFIERTKQILKIGGFAGILLPSSLLLNNGIHSKARKILLKYFNIYGICEFGHKTFAASGQNTVVVFLQRKDDYYWKSVEKLVAKFLQTLNDFSFKDTENIIQNYLSFVYPDLSYYDYINKLKEIEFLNLEKEKLLYFLLTFNQKVIICKSGEKELEKLFLGYEHSDMKKYEGIHPYPDSGNRVITSMLYDTDALDNPDKVSTHILNNFNGCDFLEISPNLNKHLTHELLHEIMDFNSDDFKTKIYVSLLDNPFLNTSNYPLVTLADENIAEILDHLREPIKSSKRAKGEYPYYGATGKTGQINDYIFDEKLVLIGEDGAKWAKGEATAYVVEGKYWVNNHAHVIRPKIDMLLHEYLVAIFNRLDFSYLKSRPNGGKLLKSEMNTIKFPLPPKNIQEEIVYRMSKVSGIKKYDILDKLLGINT